MTSCIFIRRLESTNTAYQVKAFIRKDKFYISNKLILKANTIVQMYHKRAIIEEAFRVLKQECHWSRCQIRNYNAYQNYYTVGILSFLYLELRMNIKFKKKRVRIF